jgi:hypothetical protein
MPANQLLAPKVLYSRSEVLARPAPTPKTPGVYAWYFDQIPNGIDTMGCHQLGGRALLYVGISPKEPPMNGTLPSRQSLRTRIRTHYSGNAAGSTLRLTLGCLLADQLGIALRRVGSGGRYTFTNPGERVLDNWIAQHAHVTWVATERPWEVERLFLESGIVLPLNIRGNPRQDLAKPLSAIRSAARRRADELPVVEDSGGRRRQRPLSCSQNSRS